jgi:O-glycosyl hydrolase
MPLRTADSRPVRATLPAKRANALRAIGAVTAVVSLCSAAVIGAAHSAYAADTATINGSTTYQTIAGFGASEAFGEASSVMNAPSSVQQQVLDDLYSPTTGAGLTILRNEISADPGSTIEPNNPGGPNAAPNYLPLSQIGQDQGQLWFAQQLKSRYGVTDVYADAWSAPGFMKTNNSTANGGQVCGTPGASCSSGDWRQAYANYLVQYAKDYAAAGVPLTYLGPSNEPDYSANYDSMTMSPAQMASMVDVLGPTLKSSGLSTQVTCCAATGWNVAGTYASALESDPNALAATAMLSSHGYSSAPTSPMSGWNNQVWETEWSTFESFNSAWDDGSDASGLTWAQHIYQGLTGANLNAFLYWWGSTTPSENGDNEGLLEMNGSSVIPTGRLWAFANYSRYIHPGAVRIGASSSNGGLNISAFKNTDGTVAVVVLNTAQSADTVGYALNGTGITNGTATPVVTNSGDNAATQGAIGVSGGSFTATIPARSLVTYVITPGGNQSGSASATATSSPSATATASASASASPSSTPSGGCTVQYSTTSQWGGGFTANVVITNNGTSAINGWSLAFTFAGDQKITNAWNAVTTQSGEAVTATNMSYNATIAPGGNTSFGFQGTWANSDAPPTSFTLNGVPCGT